MNKQKELQDYSKDLGKLSRVEIVVPKEGSIADSDAFVIFEKAKYQVPLDIGLWIQKREKDLAYTSKLLNEALDRNEEFLFNEDFKNKK